MIEYNITIDNPIISKKAYLSVDLKFNSYLIFFKLKGRRKAYYRRATRTDILSHKFMFDFNDETVYFEITDFRFTK